MNDKKGRTPPRQLGRVPDQEWNTLRDAAKKSGKTFTEWAVTILMRAALRKVPKK